MSIKTTYSKNSYDKIKSGSRYFCLGLEGNDYG